MQLFLYEYTSSVTQPHTTSLRAEGRKMLAAIHEDFARVPDVEVRTMSVAAAEEEVAFRERVRASDYTLVIAPELDDILLTRCRWVAEEGGRLVGPTLAAIRLAADKLALGEHLRSFGVPTPDCKPVNRECVAGAWVCKPRFGAGSTATFLIHSTNDLQQYEVQARAEGWCGESILQRYVPGRAVSVAFLCGPQQRVPLLPCAQNLSTDGRFRYLGGYAPLEDGFAVRAVELVRRALDAVPGLCGYVGVDLVLGASEGGSQDWVIEINPRLTTSYVGLRRLARSNLAAALVRVASGVSVAAIEWGPGQVHFSANGALGQEKVKNEPVDRVTERTGAPRGGSAKRQRVP